MAGTINTPHIDVEEELRILIRDHKLGSRFTDHLQAHLEGSEEGSWEGFTKQQMFAVRKYLRDFIAYVQAVEPK